MKKILLSILLLTISFQLFSQKRWVPMGAKERHTDSVYFQKPIQIGDSAVNQIWIDSLTFDDSGDTLLLATSIGIARIPLEPFNIETEADPIFNASVSGASGQIGVFSGEKEIVGSSYLTSNNGFFGIKTTNPATVLHTVYEDNTVDGINPRGIMHQESDNTYHSAHFVARKSRGTASSLLSLQTGDGIGSFCTDGYNGSQWQYTGYLSFRADSVIDNNIYSSFNIFTGNAGVEANKFKISTLGNVGISVTNFRKNIAGDMPRLQLEGLSASESEISVIRNQNNTGGSYLFLGKTRGTTIGALNIVQNNDTYGTISFVGSDGTNILQGATINGWVDDVPENNSMPGRLEFRTTPVGSSIPLERMRINNQGYIGIGTANPISGLHINNVGNLISSGLTNRGYFIIGTPGNNQQLQFDNDEIQSVNAVGGANFYINYQGANTIINGNLGKVGIGTINPSKKLDINGSVKIVDTLFLFGEFYKNDSSLYKIIDNRIGGNGNSYYSLSGADFISANPDIQDVIIAGDFVQNSAGSGGISFSAPVHIPHGATVTEIICYGSNAEGIWNYLRESVNGSSGTIRAQANINSSDQSIDYPIIDNSNYKYWIQITLQPGEYIYGGVITYTYN